MPSAQVTVMAQEALHQFGKSRIRGELGTMHSNSTSDLDFVGARAVSSRAIVACVDPGASPNPFALPSTLQWPCAEPPQSTLEGTAQR